MRMCLTAVAALSIMLCCTGTAAAQAPGGLAYVSDPVAKTVSITDVATATSVAKIAVDGTPGKVVVAPDGSRAYVIVLDGESVVDNVVAVIDTVTAKVVATVPIGNYPGNLVLSPDGRRLYVANFGSEITVIDTATNTVATDIWSIQGFLQDVAVSPDGARLYWVENNSNHYGPMLGALAVADADTGAVLQRIPVWDPISVLLAPDGATAYVAGLKPSAIQVVDLATSTVTARITGVLSLSAVSPDGRRLYVVDHDAGTVRALDAGTYDVVATIAVAGPRALSTTPDGAHVLVISGEATRAVSVIDATTNAVVATLPTSAGATWLALGPARTTPTIKKQCLHGGWRIFTAGFRNEGDCIRSIQRAGTPS